jgi:hypothetical protein
MAADIHTPVYEKGPKEGRQYNGQRDRNKKYNK